jgi:uncharacterized membrane protein (DUF4010 family)
LAQRYLGGGGFLLVSLLGGLVSSASTVAAAAVLAAHGRISFALAGAATVLSSVSSALVNLPLLYRQSQQKAVTRRVALLSVGMAAAGLVVLGAALAW